MSKARDVKPWTLTQPAFRQMLDWFDGGTNSGGQKYEELRQKLISYFDKRNCLSPNDLADETLNRVARRLEEAGSITNLGPVQFCYIKAKEVLHEYWRSPEHNQTGLDDPKTRDPIAQKFRMAETPEVAGEEDEKRIECLEQCLRKLEPGDRDMIVRYYYGEKRIKIDNHRKMAHQLGLSDKALALRALRIRKKLVVCVSQCFNG